jgi:DNA-binding transcriptional MerR regulator
MPEKSTQSAKTKSGGLHTSDDLLKIGETAKTLGVSVATIRKWCDEGLLKPVVSESGHRLFRLKEVLDMKIKTSEEPVADFVLKAKQMREMRKEKQEVLGRELKKFDGIATGITLNVKEKVFLNTDDDTVRPWLSVEHSGHTIFVANHCDGEVYEFKSLTHLHPAVKYQPGWNDIMGSIGIPKEGKIVVTDKISSVKKGTLVDLFDALSKQIANL